MNKILEIGDALLHAGSMFAVGVLIALTQILGSGEKITLKMAIGRALATGGLATSAGAVVLWIPNAPLFSQIGLAAILASLGVSGLEKLFTTILERRG